MFFVQCLRGAGEEQLQPTNRRCSAVCVRVRKSGVFHNMKASSVFQ